MSAAVKRHEIPSFTLRTLGVAQQLASEDKPLAAPAAGDLVVEAIAGRDTPWSVVWRRGQGAIALKTARDVGLVTITGRANQTSGEQRAISASGAFRSRLQLLSETLMLLATTLTPATDLLPFEFEYQALVLGRRTYPRSPKPRNPPLRRP